MSRARPTKHRFTTADKAREWLERKGWSYSQDDSRWLHPERAGTAAVREKNGEHIVTVYAQPEPAPDAHQQTPSAPTAPAAPAAAEPDYVAATDRELGLLEQYGNTVAIRKRAASELQRRLREYAELPGEELRRITQHSDNRDDRSRAAAELHRRDRARKEPLPVDALLEPLAAKHCGVDTLDLLKTDRDFKEVSVHGLRDALRAAYEAGAASAKNRSNK
jgi:hypothetical protein